MTEQVTRQDVLRLLAQRLAEKKRAASDPLYLASFMAAVDQRDGTRFSFEHLREPLEPGEAWLEERTLRTRDKNWRWQRFIAEMIYRERRLDVLKGRQIGVTWVCLAIDVAEAITMPNTASLLFRQREDEAVDNVRRWWTLYKSLPKHFTEEIKVLKPDLSRTAMPGRDGIQLEFPDGEISEVVPMTSAASSGHGRSVRRVLMDEGAYIEKLAAIRAAVEPAAGPAAIDVVSTANGRSNLETGEGNEFHRIYHDPQNGHTKIFLPYDLHPDRDQHWYDNAPEIRSLKESQRHAQFPRDEHEAFALTSRVFFPSDVLHSYREKVRLPLYKGDFKEVSYTEAKFVKSTTGLIGVYEEPNPDHTYAMGCDCKGLRGLDFNAAYVIDLATMQIAAELHGKLDADLYAKTLHFLGRWYGQASSCRKDALLAVEVGGGFGDAVIIPLRDGKDGRPPYRRLYQHILSTRPDLPVAKPWGFPISSRTRPLILNQVERALREGTIEYLTSGLLFEMESFVEHESGTSPRAEDGAHDDLVMAYAITLEMFRLKGEHPHSYHKRAKGKRSARLRPWQTARENSSQAAWPVPDVAA